jgi:hypothetical protein
MPLSDWREVEFAGTREQGLQQEMSAPASYPWDGSLSRVFVLAGGGGAIIPGKWYPQIGPAWAVPQSDLP